MHRKATDSIVTVIGIDIGKNTFHLDERGAIVRVVAGFGWAARVGHPFA